MQKKFNFIYHKKISFILILSITFSIPFVSNYVLFFFKEPWYSTINLPSFNPPSWVFGPVWSTLYFLMSFAIWRTWIQFYDKKILFIYFIHLFFNLMWSILFFGLHTIGLAFLDLVIILVFILILMKIYFEKDKLSFYLMVPYFLWSLFALVLNAVIFLDN